jgi:GntR family transcriptional repressor for pyruvate dehydrogenase complex
MSKTPRPSLTSAERGPSWAQERRSDKMAERLARQIVNDIIARDLRPGFMLPAETDMLADYDVSRGTLREALRLLEVQGLIEVRSGPKGGPMIAELNPADFANMLKFHLCVRAGTYREVLDARLAIEPMMARLAAEAQDPEGLANLRVAIEKSENVDLSNEAEWFETSHLFHSAIASMSSNTLLNLLGLSLKYIYRDWATNTITPRDMRAEVLAIHRAIADAIFAGDGERAGRLMHEHMIYFAQQSTDMHASSLDARIRWK